MMITIIDEIAHLFSLLHDGKIVRASANGSALELVIQIRYLAERVDPRYEAFIVRLNDVREMEFSPWPSDLLEKVSVLKDMKTIFEPHLDILESGTADGRILVTCNQTSPRYAYNGGELRFGVATVDVTDEGGKSISLKRLDALSRAYWDDWSKNVQT